MIPIDELEKLTDFELLALESRLRDIILTRALDEDDRARCAASLSNTIFVRLRRTTGLGYSA
jgi:hypothetical protein